MIRKAFTMRINPEKRKEYVRRHHPIWPELAAVLKEHGVHNYSIFLHADQTTLFAYAEIESDARWEAIAETKVCRRWWASMAELMETKPDDRPVSEDLPEVFHLD